MREKELTCKDCLHVGICGFHLTNHENKECKQFIPAADVVAVVRCKDCKHWDEIKHGKGWCSGFAPSDVFTDYDYFCSNGERKENDV